MKYHLLTIVFVLLNVTSFAQEGSKFKIGLGIHSGFPVGTLADNLKTGIGANAQADYFFSKKASLGAFVNYLFLGGQDNTTRNGNTTSQELNAQVSLLSFGGALNYHFTKKVFLGVGMGVGSYKTDSSKTIETTLNPNGSGGVMTATLHGDEGTGFLISPRIGYNWKQWQAILSYNNVKDAYPRSVITGGARSLQYIGITVNYIFK